MALSNWQKFRIDRGVNTNTQDSDEERAYKQEVSRQRYEAANNYLDLKEKRNLPNYTANEDNLGLSETDNVMNGTGVPMELKDYYDTYMNIPEQARGLVYAYGEKFKNGADMSTGSPGADKALIQSKTGMDQKAVNNLLTGATQMSKYYEDAKNGEGYKYLTPSQQLYKSYTEIQDKGDEFQKDLEEYGRARNQQARGVDSYFNKAMSGGGDSAPNNFLKLIASGVVNERYINNVKKNIQEKYNLSDEELKRYTDYQDYISTEEYQNEIARENAINPNSSASDKAKAMVKNSAVALSQTPFKAVAGVMSHITDRDKTLGYNVNNYWMTPINRSEAAQQQVLDNVIGNDTFGQKVGRFAYSAGMSTGEAAINIGLGALTGVGEPLVLAQFAGQSYASSYKEARQNGLSEVNANKLGLASAATETGTELISLDHLYGMYQGAKKTAVKALADIAIQAGIEGSEEAASDILNRLAQYMYVDYTGLSDMDRSIQSYAEEYMANDPQLTQEEATSMAKKQAEKDFWLEVAQDAGAGAVSGLALGAPSMMVNVNSTSKQTRSDRADIQKMYEEEYNSNEGLTEEDKIAKKQAGEYAKNPVKAQVDMIDATTEEGKARKEAAQKYADKYEKNGKLSAVDEYDLKNLIDGNQSSNERFQQYMKDIGDSTNGMNETEFRTEAIAAIKEGDADKLSTIVNAARKSTNTELRTDVDNIVEEFRGMAESNGITAEQFDSAMVTTEDAYNAGYNNTEVGQLTKIQKEAYNEGTKVRIEERAAEVKEKIKDYDENTAKVFQSNMNNSLSVDQNQNAFNSILKKSQSGMSLKSMLKDPSAIALGEEATKNIRNYGIAQYNNSLNRERAKVLAEQKLVKKGTGVFEDNRTNAQKSFDTSGLSMIAKATGFNFELTDNRSDGTKATFDPGKSLISVTEGHMQQIHHELSEVTEFYNLSEYDGLRKAALEFGKDTYGENGLSLMLDAFHTSYLSDTQTMYDSSTELANDIIASIMVMPENQQKFADFIAKRYSKKEAKTFKDQIKALLEKLINSFKSIFASIDMPDYQRAIANSKVEAASKLADQYIAALEKALDNYDELNSESVGGSPEVRKSVTTIAEALGLHLEMKDGMAKFVDDYGNEIKHFTPSMIQNTQMGAVLKYAKDENANRRFNISDSDLKKEYKMLSDLFNQMIEMKDIDLVWAINSAVGYQQVEDGSYASKTKNKFSAFTSNADPQYASTIDFTTICLKTQAIVDAMSGTMKELGRGLTKEEIVDIVYKNTHEAGEPVPCPVCYVFSRWVGLGGLLDRINTLQNKYPATMDTNKIQDILSNLEKEKQSIKKKMGEDAKVDKVLRAEYDVLAARDFSSKSIPELKLSAKEQKRFDILSQYMDVMDQETWFKNVRLNPKYKPVRKNVLFDINAGRQFAEDYPLTWKFRTTRGSGMGKATIPYSDMQLGQVIRGISSPTAVNKGTLGNLESDPFLFDKNKQRVRGGELSTSAKTILNNAIKNQKAQNLYNGQRIQSTSDFRYEYGLDYLMAYMELQAVAAKVQMYTKVPESVIMHASVNSEVNCSIMPLGYGYVADNNGNPILDENGNIQLIFSSVTGMHPDDAFNLSSMFDNVQPIIVGIGNTHIRACMADDRISFIIPYHASGSTEARYVSMMKTIEESVVNRQDYSEYQNDIEKEDATKEQIAAREMRKNILTGKYWTKGQKGVVELSKAEKQILKNNSYLDNLYRRFYVEGVDPDCYKVVIKSKPASMIMPYEYWNTGLTIKDADQNTARFKEYCESLGIIPRFSGYKKSGKYNAEFDFTNEAGYWKLLPDRRMYNRDGTYHVQKTINVANFKLDYLSKTESEKGIVMPSKVNDKSKVKGIVEKSVADINKASVRESREVDAAYLKAVEAGDVKTAQKMVDEAAKEAGYKVKAYHGSTAGKFNIFRTDEINNNMGSHFGSLETARGFAEGEWAHSSAKGTVYSVYLKADNPYETYDWFAQDDYYPAMEAAQLADQIGTPEALALKEEIKNLDPAFDEIFEDYYLIEEGYIDDEKSEILYGNFRKLLELGGYDSILYENGLEMIGEMDWIIQHPEQIKLADPVTYDDNGNVIPLSERFNTESPDIRYSKEADIDTIVNDVYNNDTITATFDERFKDLIIDNNKDSLKMFLDKGYYDSFVNEVKDQTNLSEDEIWEKISSITFDAEGIGSKDGKTYVNVHELSADNLRKAFGLGGLPAPSMAVVDVDNPVTNFGEISLIFPSYIVNPETDPMFYGDAYSASFPSVANFSNIEAIRDEFAKEYGLSDKESDELVDALYDYSWYDPEQRTVNRITNISNTKSELVNNWSFGNISGLLKAYENSGKRNSYKEFLSDFVDKYFDVQRIFKDEEHYGWENTRDMFRPFNIDNVLDEMTKNGDNDFAIATDPRINSEEELLSKSARSKLKGKTYHRYYEAKPQRIISIEDASYAVVPDNTDLDLIGDIEVGGTKVIKYAKGGKIDAIKGILRSDSDIRYSKDIGYHAGDLGKAEPYSSMSGDRGTGHFGAGTYFVGNEARIGKGTGYENRPHFSVDFSKYNLFKPLIESDGYELHEFLKGVNSFFDMPEGSTKSDLEWDNRREKLEEQLLDEEIPLEIALEEARQLFGEYTVAREILKRANTHLWMGDDLTFEDDNGKEYSISNLSEVADLEDILWRLLDDNKEAPNYLSDYHSWLKNLFKAEFILGVDKAKILNIVDEIREELKDVNHDTATTHDSASTMFMKKLGYEGIDVRKLEGLDNTRYGSVIYDLKGEDLERKIANGARFSREVDDVLWDIMNEDNPTIDQSILDKGLAALKGKQVDTRAINKIANDIKNQYGSNIDSKELSDMLSRAFAYLHKQGYVTYNDVISLFEEVARPVLDNSTKLDNVEEYNSFKDYFKDKKIKLTETQMAEVKSQYGSYSDFQRAMYPIQFSVKGDITLDSMWGNLVETFPGFIEWVNVGDQPATLNDKLNAIKPKPQNNYGADAEEVGKDLAVEIVQKYFEVQNDANAKKLAAKLAESEKQYRAEVRDRYQKKYQEAKSKLSKSAAFDEYNKKLADIKAKSKDRQMKAKDRREAAKMKKEISQTVANLHEMITNPTEKKHVPSKMVEPLTEFLSCLDFVEPKPTYNKKTGKYELKVYDYNDRYDGKNHLHFITLEADTVPDVIKKYYDALDAGKGSSAVKGWREKMINLQNMFNPTYTEEGMEDVFNMLDADLVDAFQEILDNNKHTVSINNLKSEELEVINLALKNIKKAIAEQNKAFTMKAEISAAAHGIMNTADSVKNANHSVPYNVYKTTNIHHGLNQMFVMNMMTPETYFNMLGGYGRDIYGAFQNALEKKILKVKQTSEFMTDLLKEVDTKALRDTKNAKTFQVSEGEITMTPAQIMSLYELSKRNQAVLHFAGGIEVERMGFGKVVKRYSNQNTGIHLSPSELQKIFSELTEDQIKVADAMQKYMADVCGSWGNEASLLMYDYEKFLDPNYFPIVTDSDTNLSKNEDGNDRLFNAVERMGITKSVNKYASNPIIVKDIFDVFVKHASDMATYYAYAPAVKDALRVYNYKEIETDGNDNKNYIPLKKALNYCVERSDNAGRRYYEDFIRDVNGLEKSNELSHGFDQFVSGYKAAAVGGNIRVVVQQPNAYTRAAMLIDPKYLAEAVPSMAISKKKMEELKDKHPLIYWKSQGYYETNVGKSLDSIITGEEGFRDRAIELSMALAGKADDITWSCLYNACERQIADKNPEISGDEYKAAVDKLFTDAIHETQVVDATIMKSAWQRSKSATSKLLTSFMAEPIKSYNIGLNTAIQLTRGNLSNDQKIKLATKTAMVLLVTDALTAVSQSIIDGIRHHDDDDKDYWEQVAAYWFKNMLDNVNPFGKVPFIKDVFEGVQSVINDESTSSSAGQLQEYTVMNSFLDAMKTTKKLITGDYNKTWYSAYMSIAKAASQLTGVPIYNVSKDFTSFWNFTFGDIYKFRKEAEKESDYYKAIISAIDSGRSDEDINERIAYAMSHDGTVYNATSKVSSTYKTRYLEAKEDGDVEAQTEAKDNLERGLKALGLSDDEIAGTIAKWDEENVSMSNLYDAIRSGEGIEDITNKLLETKKTDDILKNLYERFGTTVDMNRDKKIDSNIEDNLEKALDIIDGSDYDSLKTTQEANAKAKAEEAAATQEKTEKKTTIYNVVENGGDYVSAVRDAYSYGIETSEIKSSLSNKYKDIVIEMYKNKNPEYSQYIERIARLKAEADKINPPKNISKTNKDTKQTYPYVRVDGSIDYAEYEKYHMKEEWGIK